MLQVVARAFHESDLGVGEVLPEAAAIRRAVRLVVRSPQDPYLIPPRSLDEGDELALLAQRWIEANHANPDVSLAAIATAHAVGARTLQRRFVAATGDSPMDYVRRVRLEAAKRLLETTRESVDRITWKVSRHHSIATTSLCKTH